LKRVKLNGTVFSGEGEGKKFVELPWVRRQIIKKLGFIPYPGTLNLKLTEKSVKQRNLLEKAPTMQILPAEGYYSGLLFKAFIGIVECAIVLPQITSYPKTLLEVIASINLRVALKLENGSQVTVVVNV
jgi:riboflavin kinase